MKYLVLFVIVIVGLMLFKKSQQQRQLPKGRQQNTKLAAPEPMHACRHCGVNVPQSRCVWKGDKPYCCADHARLG